MFANWYMCKLYAHLGDKVNAEIHHERATNILNTIAKLNSNKAHIDSFLSSNYFHKLIQEKVTVESTNENTENSSNLYKF